MLTLVSPNAVDQIAALSDGTRRQIFEYLSQQASSVGELAHKLPVTRSAVSQHLRVLKDVGLVEHRSFGTRHVYYVDPEGLAKLRAYLETMWERALQNFKMEAEKPPGRKRR
jgi:DNA-binding transcriptional ArsR family regulator